MMHRRSEAWINSLNENSGGRFDLVFGGCTGFGGMTLRWFKSTSQKGKRTRSPFRRVYVHRSFCVLAIPVKDVPIPPCDNELRFAWFPDFPLPFDRFLVASRRLVF